MSYRSLVTFTAVCLLTACGGGGSPSTPAPTPPSNQAPVATGLSLATDPATAVTGTVSASDSDGDSLSFAIATMPASGTVTFAGANFTYTPDAAFGGVDSFTFTASDGTASSNPATVTITVNARPVVTGTSVSTSDIVAVDAAVTAADAEGDAVTFVVSSAPQKGTITAFDAATGEFTYTPDAGEDGADSFGVTASDAFQDSAEATVDVEIFGWQTLQFGTTAEDQVTTGGLVVAPDGGKIFGGSTDGPVNGAANAGLKDAWLRKIDRRGNELWTFRVGTADSDNFRSILADPGGDGVYAIAVSIPDGGVSASAPGSAVVYRIDDNGNELWSTPVDTGTAPEYYENYWSVVGDDGDLYVASWSDEARLSVLTRLDGSDGGLVWNALLESSAANAVSPLIADSERLFLRGVDMDAAGNLVVTGNYIDNSGTRSCALDCSFIAAVDSGGNLLWSRDVTSITTSCGTANRLRYYRSTVTADGLLIMTGFTDPFDPGADGLVVSYNADATAIDWTYCDDEAGGAWQIFTPAYETADGGLLVYGDIVRANDTVTGLPVADLGVVKLDAGGNVVFRRVLAATRNDGSGAEQATGSLAEDSDGTIFLNGWINGELLPGATIGEADGFIRRLDAAGNPR